MLTFNFNFLFLFHSDAFIFILPSSVKQHSVFIFCAMCFFSFMIFTKINQFMNIYIFFNGRQTYHEKSFEFILFLLTLRNNSFNFCFVLFADALKFNWFYFLNIIYICIFCLISLLLFTLLIFLFVCFVVGHFLLSIGITASQWILSSQR